MGGGRRKPPLTRHRPPLFAHAAAAHHLNRLSMPRKKLSTPPFRLAIKISSWFPGWHVVILPLDEYFIFSLLEYVFDGKCLSRHDGCFFYLVFW